MSKQFDKASINLNKFQACLQCRKRKTKCDAARPCCTTCLKSWKYGWLRSKDRTKYPPLKECQYDNVPDGFTEHHSASSSMSPPDVAEESSEAAAADDGVEQLEKSIAELEQKLKTQDIKLQSLLTARERLYQTNDRNTFFVSQQTHKQLHSYVPMAKKVILDPVYMYERHDRYEALDGSRGDRDDKEDNSRVNSALVAPLRSLVRSWPSAFPGPEMLHHLVDVFFLQFPLASRVLHRPTFQTDICLSTSSPSFPQPTLIHAVCAIASFYSSSIDVSITAMNAWNRAGSLRGEMKSIQMQPSFGEYQAMLARASLTKALSDPSADVQLQALQAIVLLTFFEYANARWVRGWSLSGLAIQLVLPFTSTSPVTHLDTFIPVVPPARDTITAEIRHNCFWLAYASDRFQVPGAAWNMFLDDKWIHTPMPCRLGDFERAVPTPLASRQTPHSPNLFTHHDLRLTDSFAMYTKSMLLLSLVKNFNFRQTGILPHDKRIPSPDTGDDFSNTFYSIQATIDAYRASFPSEYKYPISTEDGSLDVVLYMALMLPDVAIILLYTADLSPDPIPVAASKRISNLTSSLLNSSFNIGYLDPYCSLCWFIVCERLITAAMASVRNGKLEDAKEMRMDLEMFLDAFSRMGSRLPIAYRHQRIVNDAIRDLLDPLFTGNSNVWTRRGLSYEVVQQWYQGVANRMAM